MAPRAGSGTAAKVSPTRPRRRALFQGRYERDRSGLYYFDPAASERAILFCERFLRHWQGEWAGQPFDLLPWQRDALSSVFGWKRCSDGTRRYRRVSIWIAKKNGKTFFAAAIALMLMMSDNEPGAQVFSAAVDRKQAGLVFQDAVQMVHASPALSRRIIPRARQLLAPATSSRYGVLSADAKSQHGLNIHGLVCDEIHAWPNREMWDVLRYGTSSRRQPLIVSISTAGVYDPESIGWEEYDYAKKLLQGHIVDDACYALIFEADPEDDPGDPATWRKANPSLGVTLTEDTLRGDYEEARQSPAKMAAFKRLRLNIWTNAVSSPLDMHRWVAAGRKKVDLSTTRDTDSGPVERYWYGGMDLSSTMDMTGVAFVSEPDADGAHDMFVKFWVPSGTLDRRSAGDAALYRRWIDDGVLEVTEGDMVDYDAIRNYLLALRDMYRIPMLAHDPWNATQLCNQLKDQDGFELVEVRQGVKSMSAPTKHFVGLVAGKKIRHGNQPVLRYQASGFTVRSDPNGNWAPNKGKGTRPIDGIVAGIMALSLAMNHQSQVSVYDTRGVITLGTGWTPAAGGKEHGKS